MTKDTRKTTYVVPSLQKKGRVEALTAGSTDGKATDAAFPTNTPFSEVTFS